MDWKIILLFVGIGIFLNYLLKKDQIPLKYKIMSTLVVISILVVGFLILSTVFLLLSVLLALILLVFIYNWIKKKLI